MKQVLLYVIKLGELGLSTKWDYILCGIFWHRAFLFIRLKGTIKNGMIDIELTLTSELDDAGIATIIVSFYVFLISFISP